ncbi:MAG: hypothetical protein JWM30_1298 [Burkholderia sp.]|nr:hypothetical protein [Burkholderia sp.]
MATRDLRLDSLRGLFLILMTVDHIGGKITAFTYEPLGFVSAAAAFVLLSGYLYAYTASGTPPQGRPLVRQSLVRAARLYRYHLSVFALLVMLTLVSTVHRDYLAYQFYPAGINPATAMLYGAILLHQPKLMHLLPMYLLLSLLSPLILKAFHRKLWLPVFALSLALWGLGQSFDPLEWLTTASHTGAHPGDFNLLAWQLLWVVGMFIGYAHGVEKRTVLFPSPVWFWAAALGTVGFFLARHDVIYMPDQLDFYVEKSDLRALRIINVFFQVVLFCKIVRYLPRGKGLPWLRFIGKYGLPVYCFHVLLVAFLEPLSWRVGMNYGYAVEAAYMCAVIASLSIPALLYRSYEVQLRRSGARTWPNRILALGNVARGMLKPRAKADPVRID